MHRLPPRIVQLIRYAVVGTGNTLLNFATFALLAPRMRGTRGLVLANTVAFAVALLHGYYWNSRWTFHRPGSLLRFLAVCTVGLSIDSTVLAFLSSHGIPSILAKVVSGTACALWNYLATSRLVFRPASAGPAVRRIPILHPSPLAAGGLYALKQRITSSLTGALNHLTGNEQTFTEHGRREEQ